METIYVQTLGIFSEFSKVAGKFGHVLFVFRCVDGNIKKAWEFIHLRAALYNLYKIYLKFAYVLQKYIQFKSNVFKIYINFILVMF